MKYKLICTDIDGTLLDHRRQLSAKTIAAFRGASKHASIVLASSRMPSAMTHLQEELGVLGEPLICYNGGYIIQYQDGSPKVFYSTSIDVAVCEQIVEMAENTSIHVSLYNEDNWYAPLWDQWTEREATITKVQPKIADPKEVFSKWSAEGKGGHKVMCMGPEKEIDAMEKELNAKVSDHIHIYRSRPTYLELAPRAISKGSGLKLLLDQHFKLSLSDVIAFGDNYNDIDLLEMAGRGVAVANAREEVLAVADEVTVDSKADGVAETVTRYFDLSNNI